MLILLVFAWAAWLVVDKKCGACFERVSLSNTSNASTYTQQTDKTKFNVPIMKTKDDNHKSWESVHEIESESIASSTHHKKSISTNGNDSEKA